MIKTVTAPVDATRFCAIVIVLAALLFAIPYPAPGQLRRLYEISRTRAPLAIVGPSTVDFVSDCDTDKRPLYQMIGDATKRKVLNLSVGGQETSDSINLAAATIHNAAIRDVVFPLALPQMTDFATPPYRKFVSYRLFTPQFSGYAARSVTDFWSGVTGEMRAGGQGYVFEGKHYPDYNSLASSVFAREKALARCPEPLTHDAAFTRSYFWWTHITNVDNTAIIDMAHELNALLASRGKSLRLVMLPTNQEFIEKLQPGWGSVVLAKQKMLVDGFRGRGVSVLDLSTARFPITEFATPWCACAHFSESGRRHLTKAITDWIDQDRNRAHMSLPSKVGI